MSEKRIVPEWTPVDVIVHLFGLCLMGIGLVSIFLELIKKLIVLRAGQLGDLNGFAASPSSYVYMCVVAAGVLLIYAMKIDRQLRELTRR